MAYFLGFKTRAPADAKHYCKAKVLPLFFPLLLAQKCKLFSRSWNLNRGLLQSTLLHTRDGNIEGGQCEVLGRPHILLLLILRNVLAVVRVPHRKIYL